MTDKARDAVRTAFRDAEELFVTIYPPNRTEEYWKNALMKVTELLTQKAGLLRENLMWMVYDTMGDIVKKQITAELEKGEEPSTENLQQSV